MIEHRPFAGLGHAHHGWLEACHHFSFAAYRDPARMGWGSLRVWNDDTIAPHTGFAPHSHQAMEIITYVRTGAISHEDSLGNKGRTAAGDVQVMSAGTGITHAEYNRENETTTLFQIWIEPTAPGGTPSWGARAFPRGERAGKLMVLASGYSEDDDALPIRARARVLGASIAAGDSVAYSLEPGSKAYLVSAVGAIVVNGVPARPRDGLAIAEERALSITATEDAEIVLVETV